MTDDARTPSPESAPARPARAEEGEDLVFDALWSRVAEVWDDDKPHAAILDYALRAQKLPQLAGRYRALKDDPVKGERANKRVDAIVLAATQLMLSTKSPPHRKPPASITLTALAIAAALMALLAWGLLGRR